MARRVVREVMPDSIPQTPIRLREGRWARAGTFGRSGLTPCVLRGLAADSSVQRVVRAVAVGPPVPSRLVGPETDAPTARPRRTWVLAALLIVLGIVVVAFVAVMLLRSLTPIEVLERAWQAVASRQALVLERLAGPLVAVAAALVGLAGWSPRAGRAAWPWA